jgi:WD40 repeat protein
VEWVKFSPSGRILHAHLADDAAVLWDTETGEFISRLAVPGRNVYVREFGHDETVLAADIGYTQVSVRDTRSGGERLRVKTTGDGLNYALSPDSRHLAVNTGYSVSLWDVSTGERLWSRGLNTMMWNGVWFTPDGKRVLARSWSGTSDAFHVHDTATGEEVYRTSELSLSVKMLDHGRAVFLHKRAAVMNRDAEVLAEKRISHEDRRQIAEFFESLEPGTDVLMEATFNRPQDPQTSPRSAA